MLNNLTRTALKLIIQKKGELLNIDIPVFTLFKMVFPCLFKYNTLDVCCIMEGRWKMFSILYWSARSLSRIDVSFWKGLWEQRSG